MIYLHKERVLDHMQERYPANHYVMVDDKPNLLAAMNQSLRVDSPRYSCARVTTHSPRMPIPRYPHRT